MAKAQLDSEHLKHDEPLPVSDILWKRGKTGAAKGCVGQRHLKAPDTAPKSPEV